MAWCNGLRRWLATREVAIVQLSTVSLSVNDLGLVVHAHVFVTKQYNLVPVARQRCPATGKVTVGLASHWLCVTDFSGLSTLRAQGLSKGDEHSPTLLMGYGTL